MSEAGGKSQFGKKAADNFVSFDFPHGEIRLILEKVNGIHAFVCQAPPSMVNDNEEDDNDGEGEINMAWMGEVDTPSID